jgi:hypothetical protein
MVHSCLNKKLFAAFFCLIAGPGVFAQEHEFRFLPVNNSVLQSHALAGRVGTHFFLVNDENSNTLGFYLFDTVTQTGTDKQYAFPRQLHTLIAGESSIACMASAPDRTGLAYHFLELNEQGEILRQKNGSVSTMKGPAKLLVSANKQRFLLYEFKQKSDDSTQLHAALFGADWNMIKQLQYSFRRDPELDNDPEIFLDNNGNTHVVVFDKYTNYRISSDLTVNTIPFAEEQIVSETFTFQKVKLKSLKIFQNTESNCMQAEGLYVDGVSKINKGLYSIAFPLGRKNELAPRFIPFSEELVKNFRRGFAATDETILKSILLQEIIYSDEGSFVILKISNGIPQPVSKIRPEDDQSIKAFNKALSVSRGFDFQPPPVVVNTLPGGVASPTQRVRTISVPRDNYANVSPLTPGVPAHSAPLSSRASGRNAPKVICVKLEKEQGIAWHTSRSLDIFNVPDDTYNRLHLVIGEKEQVGFAFYQADVLDEPSPVLVTIRNGKQSLEKFPEKKLVFSPIQFMAPGQYGSLYLNTETGTGGLMLIQIK